MIPCWRKPLKTLDHFLKEWMKSYDRSGWTWLYSRHTTDLNIIFRWKKIPNLLLFSARLCVASSWSSSERDTDGALCECCHPQWSWNDLWTQSGARRSHDQEDPPYRTSSARNIQVSIVAVVYRCTGGRKDWIKIQFVPFLNEDQ